MMEIKEVKVEGIKLVILGRRMIDVVYYWYLFVWWVDSFENMFKDNLLEINYS